MESKVHLEVHLDGKNFGICTTFMFHVKFVHV